MNTMPRPEHPLPQWERSTWKNLNGEWDFSFDFGKSGVDRCFYEKKDWEKKIIVPFCPESDLSGIGYKDYMDAFCCILARWIMIRAYGSTEQRLDGIKAVIPLLHSISRLMYRPVQTISPYTQRTI